MAGVGYTLPVGLDLDLRFYRSMVTTYDESEGSSRYRIWTNLVEFALGYTFGSITGPIPDQGLRHPDGPMVPGLTGHTGITVSGIGCFGIVLADYV